MSNKIIYQNEDVVENELKELVLGSVEEALIEMYLDGVSVRRVENITKALWGTNVSPSMVRELKKVYVRIEE